MTTMTHHQTSESFDYDSIDAAPDENVSAVNSVTLEAADSGRSALYGLYHAAITLPLEVQDRPNPYLETDDESVPAEEVGENASTVSELRAENSPARLSADLKGSPESGALGMPEAHLPDEFQYMPPGRHELCAFQAGAPARVQVEVKEETARVLQNFLEGARRLAEYGKGDMPYLDLNHEDGAAAAWPVAFYWGGDDPHTGGIRIRVTWSRAGREAVLGRTFRRFSPVFTVDGAGNIVGSDINMGGLVNRAAFQRIQPVAARRSDPGDTDSVALENAGRKVIPILEAHGLLRPGEATQGGVDTLLASRLEKTTGSPARVEARNIGQPMASPERARARLEEAVRGGRLAPMDRESHAFWEAALENLGPRAEAALSRLPVNPALEPVFARHGGMTTAHPMPVGTAETEAGAIDQERVLDALREACPGSSFDALFERACMLRPDLFQEYR